MKILFEFSRGGLASHLGSYELIHNCILEHGHSFTNDLLKKGADAKEMLPENVYVKLTKAISESDCIVIEGSVVSLSLGYVLTQGIHLGKPVLFVIRGDKKSRINRFAWSIKSKLLITKQYKNYEELRRILYDFFVNDQNIRTRFNLVLPNKLNSFVEMQSRRKGKSKTEYLIGLINKEMGNS